MQRASTISTLFLLFLFCILSPVMCMHPYPPRFDGDLYPALFEAVEKGNVAKVKDILEHAKENQIPLFLERNNPAGTPLQCSCSKRLPVIVLITTGLNGSTVITSRCSGCVCHTWTL